MRQILWRNWRFFCVLTAVGLALRLACIWLMPTMTPDSWYYGELAKNWLQHGVLGSTIDGQLVPSHVRLPGYPAFLVAVFALFGVEHYRAVMIVQALFDLGTCFIVADMARRCWVPTDRAGLDAVPDGVGTAGERAARYAFLLTALCPFLINYVAAGLTETLTIFFTALALDLAIAAMDSKGLRLWAACGLAIACGIFLRPDTGIILAALLLFLTVRFVRYPKQRAHLLAVAVVTSVVTLAPLGPWALRNWLEFHEFQPLAPRYANDPGESVPFGFERWIRTWMVEYASVQDFIFGADDTGKLDVSKLPEYAFDTPEQHARTAALLDAINKSHSMSRELDAQFAKLAAERIRHSPFRYYLGLPLARIGDMWLRPRTELLAFDEHWWDFPRDKDGCLASWLYAALNAACLIAAAAAFLSGRIRYAWLLLGFVLLRAAFLGTIENPEGRYTLECYPVVLMGAGVALARWTSPSRISEKIAQKVAAVR